MGQQLFQQWAAGKSYVDPLSEITEQDNGIILMGMNGFDDLLVSGEAAEAGFDAAVCYVVLYLSEKVMGDFDCWSAIGFECGRRHIFQTIEPTLCKKQNRKG
jgi:hypothetical protein